MFGQSAGRARALHNLSKMVLRKLKCAFAFFRAKSKHGDEGMESKQNILSLDGREAVHVCLHVCPSACCVVCLDWGWGISLGPCCGWTCLSPLFCSETLIISLVWTVITPSLFWTSSTSFPGLSHGQEKLADLQWSRTPKSILEMEAQGDVTHKYVPRPMCLDYGPWCNLCPSLTGILMHKSNIQSYLFTTQMHAWHCKATQRLMVE